MRGFKIVTLSLLWLSLLGGLCRAAEPGDWDDPSWQLLREAHIHRDGASLAAYLREQCGADADLSRIDALIRQLSSPDFEEREKASKALVAMGPAALARLRTASNDPDAEVSQRAKDCLKRIGDRRPELTLAAVRVLIRRGGDEAVPMLVRLLPYADFEELQDDLWFGLEALTVRQGKLDPVLTEALHDPMAVRRAAAACIVGRRGDADQRGGVRKLLTDADAEVRLRAAQGLLAAKDASGVPALTALLEGTPMETAWQAEELLRYVAGEEAPQAILGAGAADDRRACRAAWETWWKGHGPKVDWAKLDGTSRRPGLMLLCDGGLPEEATGRVWLLGCDGVTRWELNKLSYPVDARLLAGGRVLVAERSLEPRVQIPLAPPPQKRSPEEGVSLRDLEGKVLWRYRGVSDPTQCQLTPDGHILIVGTNFTIAEVDTAGKEYLLKDFSVPAFHEALYKTSSLPPNSRVVIRRLSNESQAQEWREIEPQPADGLKLRRPSCYLLNSNGLQAVANGGLMVERGTGRVEQYGKKPKRIWSPWDWKFLMPGAVHAAKLPNGNILVGGTGRVVESDGDGRALFSVSFEDQAEQLRPCLNLVRLGFDAPRPPLDLAANPSAWLEGLSSKKAAVRRRSAEAVGELGRWALQAGPTLIPLLKDSDETVRDAVRLALARIYPVIPLAVRKNRRDKDPRTRQDALSPENLEPRPLQNVDSDARNGLLKDEWFASLMEQLQDEDPDLRLDAANYLGGNDLHKRESILALIDATHDRNAKVRATAADALGYFRTEARVAIPILIACLKDEDGEVRERSVLALCQIDPEDDRVFPILIEEVQKKGAPWWIAEALGCCHRRAKKIVPVFVKILESRLDGKHPSLLYGESVELILHALSDMGPEAKSAIPALRAILRDKSVAESFRGGAAKALGEMGSAAKEALPDLENAKGTDDLGRATAEAIEKIQNS